MLFDSGSSNRFVPNYTTEVIFTEEGVGVEAQVRWERLTLCGTGVPTCSRTVDEGPGRRED